jgi:hypothetical protein
VNDHLLDPDEINLFNDYWLDPNGVTNLLNDHWLDGGNRWRKSYALILVWTNVTNFSMIIGLN